MPDITMCKGDDCPLKNRCYRLTEKPSERQSWFELIPYDHYMGGCTHYIKVQRASEIKPIKLSETGDEGCDRCGGTGHLQELDPLTDAMVKNNCRTCGGNKGE